MTNKEYLEPMRAGRLPAFVDDDLTCKDENGTLIFVTAVFHDRHVMGFWSHSPWGRVRDLERGWVVIDPDGKTVDQYVVSAIMDEPTEEPFATWRRRVNSEHGTAHKLADFATGEQIWKMSDA